uniref:Uncharacterized protein n=1 Tax=Brassica oleracea TaxID=3712 RepID=A0A3P6FA80_BRAOL|nr:unnamed protein product [Brassica oleracea]
MALAINVSSSSSSAISTSSFPSSELKVSAPRIGSLRLSDRVNVSTASLSLSGKRSSSVKPLNVQSIAKESFVPSQAASMVTSEVTEKLDVVEMEDFEELAKSLVRKRHRNRL